ncbi:uncharacterized protein PHACADRAFT_101586 [Phanerochaete carnosa HHB-10118-sp]|uniref:C3H1-type domain-containing protein n=1 Tax=Phanerochaete carnosa (strain HHB-10118-sp) TaxID=650164 RepID=K5VXZ6_PHACS|nr:uncharacterized protein PHACADRAFT_101586 [Phanerochaete carnosa HHB-10118-sp]EKM51695.1 hypothetical protein PHACADRAFT_101586 [Phanerochaete carnosa HHB-10118-sp]
MFAAKPCKFFHGNGTCVKGNKCNFIHDQNQARHPSQSPDVSSSSMSRRRRAAKRAQAKAEEAEKRSNYYPITWRVIGGGVMMGGQREVCQASLSGECSVGPDCKFSHPLQEDKELHGLPDAFSPSHYDSTKHFSRISPVCLGHPVMHCQAPTPLPREMKVSASGSTIIEVQNIPGAESAVLDGSTLLPRRDVVEDDTNAPTADAPSTEYALPSARTIVRPVSTPPAMKVSTVSIVGLFQAETSW